MVTCLFMINLCDMVTPVLFILNLDSFALSPTTSFPFSSTCTYYGGTQIQPEEAGCTKGYGACLWEKRAGCISLLTPAVGHK